MASLFGMGRPQPSSAERIAAVEAEIELMSDMFSRYVLHSSTCTLSSQSQDLLLRQLASLVRGTRNERTLMRPPADPIPIPA